ncbi:phage shock protein PspC (stress-responsive transcriptional regulator) [Arthrobacter woluwensis]|uniref:PspC domain-containing protein n=1 Tax=Arthrobacter woluwensis TaxID=156980 RepID=UPI00277FDFCD|nr:PspC domain-containing protein [Arthrobacter woluwensis]MDQ0709702.1 phage shock protein PspC (stress-responsive transcriptional regulator) [Arthrobacter woluwensis]
MNTHSTTPEEPRQPAGATAGAGRQGAGTSQEAPGTAHTSQDFFSWIRSLGIRRGSDRWLGGVCSGLADRFGIDPLIVRGIFIVLAVFAGIGVLAYGVAWALLPEPDGRIHVQEAGAGRWSGGMTGALITTIIGFPSLGRGFWDWGWNGLNALFWTLVWVGAAAFGIYYLIQHKRAKDAQRHPAEGFRHTDWDTTGVPQPFTAAAAGTAAPAPAFQATTTDLPAPPLPSPSLAAPSATAPHRATPPAQPRPPKIPRHRQGPGSALVAVFVGLALLVGGALKALDAARVIDLGTASTAVVLASGAAVLGLGVLIAGIRGRTSGFLGFLAVVGLVIGAFFTIAPRAEGLHFQNRDWTPAGVEQARQGFDLTGGKGTVDLSGLGGGAPLSSRVVVPLDVTAGSLTLVIPENIPVQIRTDLTFASLEQDGSDTGHVADKGTRSYNDGKPGQPLVIELDGTFSNISVQEGSL